MDLHPTPFPGAGKRRPAENHATKKEGDRTKSAASLFQSKQKRTFGRDLSCNVTTERQSQKHITTKPWKPSGVSRNTRKPVNKVSTIRPGPGGAKSGSNKKAQHVTFQETPPLSAKNITDKVAQDDIVCTPVFSTKPLMQETPYHSAENCSKCRLDRLETSSYWLSQIKLAEVTGKHFVSAAFFRLALECKAQPFVRLQNELKHYRDRHRAVSLDSLWDDLCLDYGLTSDNSDGDRIDAVLVEQVVCKCTIGEEVNFVEGIHNCLDYVIIDKPEVILEDLDAIKIAPKESVHVEHSGDGTPAPSSSMNSPHRNCKDVECPGSNSVVSGGFKRSFKIAGKKSIYDEQTSNEETENKATNKSNISGKKGEQAGTKIYDCEPDWSKHAGALVGQMNQLKSQGKTEEQCTGSQFDDNVSPEEGLRNQLKGKNKTEEHSTGCPLEP